MLGRMAFHHLWLTEVTLPDGEMLIGNASLSSADEAVDKIRRCSRATIRKEIATLEEYNELATANMSRRWLLQLNASCLPLIV